MILKKIVYENRFPLFIALFCISIYNGSNSQEVYMKNYLNLLKSSDKKPVVGLKDLSRLAATEGIVLLKNEGHVLPLIDQKISVFGRIQEHYYKSGTGSGGLVNVDYVTSIIDAFLENPFVKVDQELLSIYRQWENENPFNAGSGFWASEPWSQVEMPLTDDIVIEAKKRSDVAIVIIGRTAGEDKDNTDTKGSYRLSDGEDEMLKTVTTYFDKVVVLLNTGNIMDMSFMDRYKVQTVLYLWHGGQEGGRAAVDILTGLVSPSGKLPDTIPYNLSDLPASKTFGGHDESEYIEDIYVGYRYFQTFCKDNVRYPFGFGLSYTSFSYKTIRVDKEHVFNLTIKVKNTGSYAGKEVVQVYVRQPQGLLGKPEKVLVGFAKTGVLKPGEAEVLSISFELYDFASYDEAGQTGFPSSYVLEKGMYTIELATDVNTVFEYTHYEIKETLLIEKCDERLRPVKPFKRIKPVEHNHGLEVSYEDVPLRSLNRKVGTEKTSLKEFKKPKSVVTFSDVYQKKYDLEDLVAQMSKEELAQIVRGEGMSSPKVTPGTASAFGGTTEDLARYGLPIVCCADGPSGIRMDSGSQATSMPNGTLLAASMNVQLAEALYYSVGLEMIGYRIEILLGPGMNIHRHPLCGRNFEYFSEDPVLTGLMGAAVIKGLQKAGVTGTIKHIALNNQEYRRFDADSIASERAIREIYLKGFEIAIKKAHAKAAMTSYNPINGIWTAGNEDLISGIMRHEWGFKGIVMTDWWAKMNEENEEATRTNIKQMVKAQGDLYMVVVDSRSNSLGDNAMESFENGSLKVSEAQLAAKNIISYLLNSYTYLSDIGEAPEHQPSEFPLPILNKVFVDGLPLESFDPRVTHYVLDHEDDFQLTFEPEEHASFQVKRNKHHVIVSLLNHQVQNHYVFTNRKRLQRQDVFNYEDVSLDNPYIIDDKAWGKTHLDITKPTWANEFIVMNQDEACFRKNGLLSFAIDIKTYGKYIVELTIASDVSGQAQIPFSILSEDYVLSTLTTNGTDGKFVDIASQVIINEGVQRLTFKAHSSGLRVKRIDLIKHQ